MARINEAWHILSDPVRRARWDRDHSVVVAPHWATQPDVVPRQARTRPPVSPATSRDSGWLALGAVGGVVVLIGVLMLAISVAASGPPEEDSRARFVSNDLSLRHPPEWVVAAGTDASPEHRIIAHLVTYSVDPGALCTTFGGECELIGSQVPPGEASILITAWQGGTPPVPDPVVRRSYGLDADRIIAGRPAAFELERGGEGARAWWQLSPPGFPDQWIEVTAEIGGGQVRSQDEMLREIEDVLQTVEFSGDD